MRSRWAARHASRAPAMPWPMMFGIGWWPVLHLSSFARRTPAAAGARKRSSAGAPLRAAARRGRSAAGQRPRSSTAPRAALPVRPQPLAARGLPAAAAAALHVSQQLLAASVLPATAADAVQQTLAPRAARSSAALRAPQRTAVAAYRFALELDLATLLRRTNRQQPQPLAPRQRAVPQGARPARAFPRSSCRRLPGRA